MGTAGFGVPRIATALFGDQRLGVVIGRLVRRLFFAVNNNSDPGTKFPDEMDGHGVGPDAADSLVENHLAAVDLFSDQGAQPIGDVAAGN